MDGTGAGTGRSAGTTDVTEGAEDVTTGPSRPVGRADATGPLPIQTPVAPTAPLPTPQPGTLFAPASDAAAPTTAQPVVPPPATPPAAAAEAPTPSWFATGPLPLVPPPPAAATPPAGLFEPATAQPPTAATGPQPALPAPPTEAIPVVPAVPQPPAPTPSQVAGPPPAPTPLTGAIQVGGSPPTPPIASPPDGAGPVDGRQPAVPSPPAGATQVGDSQPVAPAASPSADSSPVADRPPAAPAAGPPTGLFTPATPPAAGSVPAPAPDVAPPGLFTAAVPAAPPPAPATGLFAAVAPAPVGGTTPPAATTSPIPVVAAPPPPVMPPSTDVPPPAPPPAQAWAFPPGAAGPAPAEPAPSPPADVPRAPVPPVGHPTGITSVKAGKPAKRRAWPLTVGGVLVAIAAGIALVFSVARTNPADLAATAAAGAGGWPGAHYVGAVAANDGGEIRFDLTVTPDGAAGTLSRDGGRATAELVSDQGGTLLRANREWWLYHHPTRADDLADAWVAEPITETQEIAPVLGLSPAPLAAFVRGEPPAQWQALEQQLVDGRSGVVLSDGARRVVVGGEDTHPLLALDIAPESTTPPVPVSRPTDEELAAVSGAAARVRQEAAPKSLAQVLQERPNVGIQLQPDPLCTAETCNVTITVTNSGTAPARGRLEVSADGNVVANHPLDVPPGQVATFTAAAPNPQFAKPGANGQILWETRAVDD